MLRMHPASEGEEGWSSECYKRKTSVGSHSSKMSIRCGSWDVMGFNKTRFNSMAGAQVEWSGLGVTKV